MAFGRASGRLQLPLPSVRVGPAYRPIGEQASYEAAGEEPPHGHPPLTTSAPPPSVTATESAQASEVSAPQVSARVQPPATGPLTPEVNSAGLQPSTEVQAQLAITDGTEQDEALEGHDLDNTEHGDTELTVPEDTEQERRNEGSDTEWNPREKSTEADEAKSESDDPADYRVNFDVFDSDNFMEGLRKEQLFGPTDGDDVNVVAGQDASDSDSDADNEDVMNANEVVLVVEGVEDLEDVSLNDDIPEEGLFDLTSGDLRDIAENGWITYAEAESGNLWMDAATDYYDGPCGPTRSAVAYADSPLTMFFYFLPKELWIRVADETNRYREQNIGAVALSRQAKMLARQAEDPRVSVPNLEDIEAKLRKFKRIQAHEILHVVVLLFARAVAPIRDGLSNHWRTEEDGAIPRGMFSRFMKRDRFEAIMKFLHFNNNDDGGAHADRAWKIRPVLQAVEKTFKHMNNFGWQNLEKQQ